MVILFILVYSLGVDGLLAPIFYSGEHPQISRSPSPAGTDAVLFLTGTQSDGAALAAPMLSVWKQHGDVVIVQYPRESFDAPTIVADIHQQLMKWHYRRVTIIGGSLGGLMAADLVDYDRTHGRNLQFRVVLTGVPAGTDTLFDAATARNLSWFYPGPVDNLFSPVVWGFSFHPETPSQQGKGVDSRQLKTLHDSATTWPLSGEAAQVRYITGHTIPAAGAYRSIPMVYLQAQLDKVVRPASAEVWLKAFSGSRLIAVPAAWHIDFAEHPQEWAQAFDSAFQAFPAGK